MEPELLVLDEPFEGLDPFARRQMIDLLDQLTERGATVILTTHDIDSVPELADYCYVLRQGGEIALEGTPADIFASPAEIARSNIKPPVLAELFARLRELDSTSPEPALTVEQAACALERWRTR
jgi:cobalt/nickel transport system ATP-binding protein